MSNVAPTFHQDWTADRGGPWQLTGAGSAPTYDVGRGVLSIPVPPGGYDDYGLPEPAVVVLRGPWDFPGDRGEFTASGFSAYIARAMLRAEFPVIVAVEWWQPKADAYGEAGPAEWRYRNADHSTPVTGGNDPAELVADVGATGAGWDYAGGRAHVRVSITSEVSQTVELRDVWAGLTTDDPGPFDAWPADTEPDPEPEPEPEPEPDPEPGEGFDDWEELASLLAPKVAGYAGLKNDPAATELAESQLPIVVAFVHGYTRGRGFTEDVPNRALRAIIVSAAARLVVNPEQVIQYSSGDYSETSARLTGFTLIERKTLNNYRRIAA